ncbi:MAG: YIP1 family protein [Candidatus Lokiarchaeia archaeon]
MSCPKCGALVAPDEEVCPECNYRLAEETLERLLPLLKRPEKEPISPMPFPIRIAKSIIAPSQAFHDIARAPDAAGPFILYVLNVLAITIYYAAGWNHIFPLGDYWILRVLGDGALLGRLASNAILVLIQFLFLGFIYWLPFRLIGRKSSFKRDLSIVGYAYIPVLIGRAISILILFTGLPIVVIPGNASFLQAQFSVASVFMSSVWNTVTTIEIACWLWAAFLIALGIRQVNELSTAAALISSYAIMIIFLVIYASLI